jgi:hypothetical protein
MREHWLEHAHGRIVAGDNELDVLADYGWVQITDAEREAIEVAISGMYRPDVHHLTPQAPTHADTLRKLLERLT